MGCFEGWTDAHPNDFYPSGLAPDEEVAYVPRVLEPDRWSIAEERTAELIACIQPNQLSEERRRAVTSYVQRLITKCISCEVFTFGSVPLKTYLPDGDIDLSAFGNNDSSKGTLANKVHDMLMREEKNGNAKFCVTEVQYIQAEVKIIKCLVDDIVVDISFNQLGGLCTLCFLEKVDRLVGQNHLFKRSIILIKAWCYYESQILGAHRGLISTYALETLVLYIFHVFHGSFAGPLEVLYRFLEFFSKFDWDNFCVGLWGPVPIRSLPDMTADPPPKDGGGLLFSKLFLDACSSVYSDFRIGRENHELPFMSKHFNVIDPLRANNNLGHSVSKGNFFRIRDAFALGAQRLARLLDCPKENIVAEVNQFFKYALDRHGKQLRHDAPRLLPVNGNGIRKSNNLGHSSSKNIVKENSASHESEVEMTGASHASHNVLSQHENQLMKQESRPNTQTPAVSHTHSQNKYTTSTSSMAPDLNHELKHSSNSNANAHAFNGRSSRPDRIGNEIHCRYQFARSHSSPELTDTSRQISTQGRHNKASETLEPTATRIMADDPHGVSFHQFCVENLQTFWRFSIYGQPVALTNIPRLILRKILNVVKSCHDNNMSSGNLLDNIIVINNEDVVLAVGPVPLDLVNPRLTMHSDLVAVWDLVLHAVNTTTPRVLPEAVRSLNNLYASLRPFYERGDDLRRIEFFLFNSPLFLDVKGKYLLYRKILNLAEHRRRSFLQNLDLTGVGDWLASVRNPLLIAIRDYDNYVNLPLYKTYAGSIQFYRNALAHLNQGQSRFMSDASIMIVLEDDIPMVLPELFNALVRGMDQNPACTQICGMTLDDFLRAPITDFVEGKGSLSHSLFTKKSQLLLLRYPLET